MHASGLETASASVQWPPPDITPRGPHMNKFEQVFSDHHQMSLAGAGAGGIPGLMSMGEAVYSEVQYIIGNGPMGTPCGQTEAQTEASDFIGR